MDDAKIIAWVDGELSPEEAREVAAAVARDPALAAQADKHRRMKARFAKAFGGLLDDAAKLPKVVPAPVVSLAAARAQRAAAAATKAAPVRVKRNWSVPAAVAASLVIGIAVGLQVRPMPGVGDTPGALALAGPIAQALDDQPSGVAGPIRVALSFKDQSGGWCRSFAATSLSGVACRSAQGGWQMRYATDGAAPQGDYRMAGGDAVLGKAVDAMIAGAPLDAAQEKGAIAAGWR